MHDDEPGLFELSEPERPVRQRPPRGRNRETWARTVTAEIRITDVEALREAAERARNDAVTIVLGADSEDSENDGAEALASGEPLDDLAWLVWPTEGLEELQEASGFRILSMELDVHAGAADRGAITWTVTVKLTDVDALRRFAAQAHPREAGPIADSLAVAWQCAVDPFTPLRSIPGIAWEPGPVEVHHLPARANRRPG